MESFAKINWLIDEMKRDLWNAWYADDPSGYNARLSRHAEAIIKWVEFRELNPSEEEGQ